MTEPGHGCDDLDRRDAITQGILRWFDRHQRTLPWRQTRDPYRILVSEVMLQQTQVDRVLPFYERFLTAFPTVEALAAAPVADVIRLWAGLGYNRRAVNLHRAAQAVAERHGSAFPSSIAELKALPGIGDYTAGAVACFAWEQDVAFVDTNMKRVIERVCFGPDSTPTAATLLDSAALLVPSGNGWRWNQALMEFGALHCTSRKPLCGLCPLQSVCRSFPVAQQQTARGASKVAEGFEGSNRYYRGRVLAVLRDSTAARDGVTLRQIGERLRADFGDEHLPWLSTLVEGLERDGLARVAETPESYDAGPSGPRVSLP